MTIRTHFALFLLTLAAATSIATVIASPAETTAGNYRDWNSEIDEVTIIQQFRADSYRDIIVEPLDSTGLHLPDRTDKEYPAVISGLKAAKQSFIDGLRKNLRARDSGAAGAKRATKALVIRARLTEIDPGSENARYFLGFGAGAVKLALVGEIFESASHRTLVTFKQERRSAVGPFGSTGFTALFARTARQIGGDVATLINAF